MTVTTVTSDDVPHGVSADVWENDELEEGDDDAPDEPERLPRRGRRRRRPRRRA